MEDGALVRYHRSAQQRAEILAAYQQSGLSVSQFVAQQGLCRTTLERWIRDHKGAGSAKPTELVEVPNPLTSVAGTSGCWAYRVQLAGGLILELSRGFDPGEVRALIQLLQSV